MSTIAKLTLPAEEFALSSTLDRIPTLEAEVERVVAHEPDTVMPYVWFGRTETDLEELDDALQADSSVDSVELLTDLGDERLYRMNWVEDVTLVVHALTEEEATILDASGEGNRWRLRILFPERDALSRTYDFAEAEGLTIDVEKIHELDEARGGRYGLTDAQYETLVQALEHGYYQIPREVDMEELATELDISHQALSERLRRAHRRLVEEAISIGPDGSDDRAA